MKRWHETCICILAALGAVVFLASCGSSSAPAPSVVTVSGAGATFPLPLYQRWAADFSKTTTRVQVSTTAAAPVSDSPRSRRAP